MKLIITRHGETVENINNICQDQTGGQLSPKGIIQANKLALRFKGFKIDLIYSSDAQRTIDTSEKILKYHPNLKLNLDQRLREQFLGRIQGRPFPKDWDWTNLPDDCETKEQMCNKAKNFLNDICLKHNEKTVLVVCHDGSKRALLTVIHNKPATEYASWQGIKNTCVSEFDIDKNGNYKVRILNCTKHLEK